MSFDQGLIIQQVLSQGIGAELDWESGDRIIAIGGIEITDLIDYQFQIAEEYLEVLIVKKDGSPLIFELEKDYDENLGVSFTSIINDEIRQCHNRCLFCFVDQLPMELRPTLYVKDDDYRYSFLQGTFVTLTNISPKDLERIVSLRLSPLYVSVHTTNPELRVKMLRNKNAAKLMEYLKVFAKQGIEIHTQIVLCAGVNDGLELKKSIEDLSQLWPSARSLAVVPVGLTKFREGLANVRAITLEIAKETIEMISNYQNQFLQELGTRFVYLSDEFYLQTGEEIPAAETYEDFPQLENGVGLVRLFIDEFYEALDKLQYPSAVQKRYLIVTSCAAAPVITGLIDQLNQLITGISLHVAIIENHFLGSTVTVAGLLSGSDLVAGLLSILKKEKYSAILLPDIILNKDGLTIDNFTKIQLEEDLGIKTIFLPCHGSSLIDYLF